ncbi:FAD-dependent monooxygenase [Gordonia sp. PKS22-38]|uniref:FAD-dependent monooxygenase n=1 Tax=Gordonia prachuapensis TaxID=3115651 RepID=A0ABU7MXG6_9ACTN|nr:FAD-dependent monooxygenase [Gordonia sp. PKS22-38]
MTATPAHPTPAPQPGRDIAIVGGGIGGLAAAIALRNAGLDAVVFEQTTQFARVGADINLTPNAVRVLDTVGGDLGARLRDGGAQPRFRISRMWDTGVETSRIPMGASAEERYGAPQLTLHRGDLMSAMRDAVPDSWMRMGRRVQTVEFGERATLVFDDGTRHDCAVVIGADGIHSRVRTAMFGPEHPEFTGVVAYRAVLDREQVAHLPNMDSFTKWWGPDPDTQIVVFPLNRGKEIFVFATIGQPEWTEESWTTRGSVDELRAAYRDFHPEATALLDACGEVMKSALYVRDPLESWTNSQGVLLGDACHPMMPFMAQGAGQAIEDAAVLARCLATGDDTATAVFRYQETRRERTAAIQRGSRSNEWLKEAGNGDWVYEYDAWSEPLGGTATAHA